MLLSKFEALTIYMDCESRNDGDERADAQLFPAFMETMAAVGGGGRRRGRGSNTPECLTPAAVYVCVHYPVPRPWPHLAGVYAFPS